MTNRLREQLWRYFPAMLELESNLAAPCCSTPGGCSDAGRGRGRVRETTFARVLKQNRIRRFDRGQVLEVLRKEPVVVADGTTAAAQAHVTMLIARIRLLNQ